VTTDRWEGVERLFAEALERPEAEREAFVRASASGPDVTDEVIGLLRAHLRTGLFDPVTDRQEASQEPTLDPGSKLGAWEVTGELGRGGMGVVYRVRRADGQFDQEAALKILPTEARGPHAEARFLAERQILARLSHPNIARLLDGGVSDDGRPWFAMDRVEGEALDAWCDDRRLDVDDRLRLFLRVCDGVQYAHQNLIVHRDLKPGNILVTETGEPRLLDFGIAKILDDDLRSGDSGVTQLGARILTPEYASPEQFRGEPVTTASDVYQLGLLLRRLLAGGGSKRSDGAGWTPTTTGDADRPSHELLTREDRQEIAAARSTTPDRLAHKLRGDLESILLKALRQEPDQRYGTAGQLADDLERYLEGRPVRARPDTWRYVAGKFMRRHALALSAMAGAFLLVAGLALGMHRQARKTAVERDRAEEVVKLLVGLFQSADPMLALDDSVTVREVLDRGAARIRTELAGQPAVRAALMSVIAEVYGSLGMRDKAIPLLQDAVATGSAAIGEDDPGVAASERRLGMFQAEMGNQTAADTLLAAAEVRLEGLRDLPAVERAKAMNDIGHAWQVLGRLDRAEPLLERSLDAWGTAAETGGREAATYTNLGWVRAARADLDSAEVLFRKSLGLRRSILGPDHPAVATSLEALSWTLTREGSLKEADSAIGAALSIRERVLPWDHPGVLSLRAQRANVLRGQGRNAEAEAPLRDVLAGQIASLGEDHFVVADTHNDLGLTLQAQGRDAEAEPHFRAAWAGYRAAFGDDHSNPAVVEVNLARLLFRTGQNDEAEAHFAHATPIVRKAFPRDRRFLGDVVSLGTLRCRGPDPTAALAELREVAQALGAEDGHGRDDHLRALNALAACLERHGRIDEARPVVQASLEASADRPDADPYRAFALGIRARLGGR